jgi:hypothetical protein
MCPFVLALTDGRSWLAAMGLQSWALISGMQVGGLVCVVLGLALDAKRITCGRCGRSILLMGGRPGCGRAANCHRCGVPYFRDCAGGEKEGEETATVSIPMSSRTARWSLIGVAVGAVGLVALGALTYKGNTLRAFTQAVRRADQVVLYEGLPHQFFEKQLLAQERRTRAVEELNGWPFYQEPLALPARDAERLSGFLGEPATYLPFKGEKLCGGFHPDYAVQWHVGASRYRALLCFGCGEVMLFGPGLESRNELDKAAGEALAELLKGYRKHRPGARLQDPQPAAELGAGPDPAGRQASP